MSALKKLYASGGHDVLVACLSFRCSAWPSNIHLCQRYQDMLATTETGEQVLFVAADFASQLAKKISSGQQSLQFIIGANSEALSRIDEAMRVSAQVYVDYREYIEADKTSPARPVESLSVVSYRLLNDQIIITASFHDLTNKAWPRKRYNTTDYPGLKHYAG